MDLDDFEDDIPLHCMKSIDHETSVIGKDKVYNLADRIKLAAIHDDEAKITQIFSSETSMENGL